jgi:leader peptidase (prepilin peptidase)/N-methyltransferase
VINRDGRRLAARWFEFLQWGGALLLASIAATQTLSALDAVIAIAFAALVLFLTKSDLERFELPDYATLAVGALGLVWVATLPDAGTGFLHAALRAIAAAVFLSAIKSLYRSIRRVEGLGWGDVKLAAAGAVWLDWSQLPIALLIASGAGILTVGARALHDRDGLARAVAIPFGAFLAPSIWLVWFAGLSGLF